MAYGAWRGMVGTVKPTKGSGSLEELIRMLPDGIGVIPLFNNIRHGTIAEFRDILPSYEEKVAELAAELSTATGVDPITVRADVASLVRTLVSANSGDTG